MDKKIVLGVFAILVIIGSTAGYYYWYLPAEQRRLAEEAKKTAEEVLKRKNALIPRPDTIVHQVFNEPQFLDPATESDIASDYLVRNVYETLLWFKGASADKLEAKLAEDMPTISPDGLVYTFKLRKSIKFHDGTPLNASAVKYSLDRSVIMNRPNSFALFLQVVRGADKYMKSNMTQADVEEYLSAEGFQVVDDYTLRVRLERSYAPILFVFCLPSTCVVSPTAVQKHGGVSPGKDNEWMNKNMVGTGPFKFVEWIPKQRVVLDAFEGYWRGPARIKRAIIQNVPELSSRELALFTGEADIIDMTAANAFDIVQKDSWIKGRNIMPRTDLALTPTGTGISAVVGPTLPFNFVAINQRFPPLNNKDFRYGLCYAFDYDTFINEATNGFAIPIKSIIPKGVFGSPDDVFSFTYDPAKAKEYFLKAKTAGAYQDGVKVTMFYNTGDEIRRRGGLLLRDSVARLNVGVTIDVQEVDYPQFLRQIRAKTNPLFMGLLSPDIADPGVYVEWFGHSQRGAGADRALLNLGSEWEAKIDKMFQVTDPAERAKLAREIANRINEEACFILPGQRLMFKAMRDWVRLRTDPDLKVPIQANPMFDEYSLYDLWKEYQ